MPFCFGVRYVDVVFIIVIIVIAWGFGLLGGGGGYKVGR